MPPAFDKDHFYQVSQTDYVNAIYISKKSFKAHQKLLALNELIESSKDFNQAAYINPCHKITRSIKT